VVHFPTCTTIYIDASGTNETRTIMRAELVAIYKAIDKFAPHEWIGIFTESLSSIHAIRHRYTTPGSHGPQHYHHHVLLLSGIRDLLEKRRWHGFRTTLHRLRAHTHILSNYLAYATAKLTVTQYESLPEDKKLKVNIGEVAPRPPILGHVHNKTPDTPYAHGDKDTDSHIAPAVVFNSKAGRLQLNDFTRPS